MCERPRKNSGKNMRAVKFLYATNFSRSLQRLLYGRSDDNALEFMIRWTFTILVNFTVGMFGAIIGFTFSLPSVIYGLDFLLLLHIFFHPSCHFCYFRGVDVVRCSLRRCYRWYRWCCECRDE